MLNIDRNLLCKILSVPAIEFFTWSLFLPDKEKFNCTNENVLSRVSKIIMILHKLCQIARSVQFGARRDLGNRRELDLAIRRGEISYFTAVMSCGPDIILDWHVFPVLTCKSRKALPQPVRNNIEVKIEIVLTKITIPWSRRGSSQTRKEAQKSSPLHNDALPLLMQWVTNARLLKN